MSEERVLVDRDAAMPLYHQIFLQLRDEIVAGVHPFGSTLPTEQDLSAKFGVSRITARRVLDDLARQGFVERKRRIGTKVIFRSPVKPIEANIDQAMDSLLALGHGTAAHVLDVTIGESPFAITEALRLPPHTEVVRAVRIRLLEGLPLGHVLSYVPGTFASFVTRETLERAPILKLLADAGHKPNTAEQRITAVLADVPLAEALHIEPRSALLKIIRTIFDENGVPMLFTVAHYRSDRFSVRLDLSHL